MSESHSEGVKKGEFCAVRKDGACDCGNDHQKNCTGWSNTFIQGRKKKVVKRHEAHHVLCVASVTEFIGKNDTIMEIVLQTKWCINAKSNMMAMPLWGHTIQWYCNLAAAGAKTDATKALVEDRKAPPFKNIPMHDYDHNSANGYKKSDVDTRVKKLAGQIDKNKKKHKAAVKQLRSELNSLSKSLIKLLKNRGSTRCGGTHKAWKQGMDQPESNWYLPFSMASTGTAEKRTFPTSGLDDKLASKIERLAKAISKWGPS